MINRDDIEVGDKVYTRDGGCLVAREVEGDLYLADHWITCWSKEGKFTPSELDIIRIEKAPEPVVEVNWFMWDDEFSEAYLDTEDKLSTSKHAIKLTIINGKLEKSEQIK